MGEPAEDHQTYQQAYQHTDTVDVDGIEIFSPPSQFGNLLASSQQGSGNLPASLSIKEAAKVLGVSVNTVRARIKSGELAAGKAKGRTNEQWRVFLGNLPASSQQLTSNLPASSETLTNPEVTRLLDMIEAQAAKLEAASMQIGYYKAQWEASQDTIKLLTDSQHKAGWWRNFCSWFKRA